MKFQPKTLRVYPNPWGAMPGAHMFTMDAEGRPCGVVLREPEKDAGNPFDARRMVGARFDQERTVVTQQLRRGDNLRSARQTTVYSYMGNSAHELEPFALATALAKCEPVKLPFLPYYIDRLRHGELIAADKETADAAGIKFADPKALIAEIAHAAAEAFNKHFDGSVDVYAALCAERKREADEAAAAAAKEKESSQ